MKLNISSFAFKWDIILFDLNTIYLVGGYSKQEFSVFFNSNTRTLTIRYRLVVRT